MTYQALQVMTSPTSLQTSEYIPTGTDEDEYRQLLALQGKDVTDDSDDDILTAFGPGVSGFE